MNRRTPEPEDLAPPDLDPVALTSESAERTLTRLQTRDARIRQAIEAWAARDVTHGAEPYRARDLLASIWNTLGGDGRLFDHVGERMAADDDL